MFFYVASLVKAVDGVVFSSLMEVPKINGVYQIHSLDSGKVYIGSSSGKSGIRGRFREHLARLNKQRHRSQHLQNAVNKYGLERFEFSVLEETEACHAVAAEQRWLDELRPYERVNGYNTNIRATSAFGTKRSAETRARMSAYQLARHQRPEVRAERLAWGDRQARSFTLVKDGVVLNIKNLNKFCRERGLTVGCVSMVLAGRRNHHKGYHLQGTEIEIRSYKFMDPHGQIHTFSNLNAFCKERGLTQPNMSQVYLGRKANHKGWTYVR